MSNDMRKDFDSANPQEFTKHAGNGEIFAQLREADAWARKERLRVAAGIMKNRETWLNEEREKQAQERSAPSLNLEPDLPKSSIDAVAREKVQQKVIGLMAAVETERQRRRAEIANLPHASHLHTPERNGSALAPAQSPRQNMMDKASAIQARADRVRIKARTHFNRMKPLFIADAQASGANTPVKEVFDNYRQRLSRIDRAEDRLLSQTFKDQACDRPVQRTRRGPTMD